MDCPICRKGMDKKTSHGVEVDVCAEHGLWLDKGELQKILASVRETWSAGMTRQRKDAQGTGRLEGIFLGWWSLLLPRK